MVAHGVTGMLGEGQSSYSTERTDTTKHTEYS